MIHPQLLADCHVLGRFSLCSVLVNKNASLPWFILVPETELEDVLDLHPALLGQATEECQRISRFLKRNLGYAKVNFAGLGNVVPQMHLHIIGRSPQDPCWPQPVWGNLPSTVEYTAVTLAQWGAALVADYQLQAA